jgi:hypothetical protein
MALRDPFVGNTNIFFFLYSCHISLSIAPERRKHITKGNK